MSLRHIYKWIGRLNGKQSDMYDEQQTGHLWDLINDETIACMRTLLAEDRWFTISDIHREMVERYLAQTRHTAIFRILTEKLERRKVSAWWVLHMLAEDNCWNHM